MAFLNAKEWQFGRQNVFATDVGASDLPSTNTSGVIQVGDWCINLSGSIGAPIYWVCTAQTTTSVTWTEAGTLGTGNTTRTSAGSTTLLSTDDHLFITAAGTVTLPAPNSTIGTHSYRVKALGIASQPVTLSATTGVAFDSVTAGSQTLSANEEATLFTDATSWYTMGRDPLQQARSISTGATLSVTDKFVLAGAGTYVLPVYSLAAIGQEVVVHATASSVTITPSSGNINGSAAATLTSGNTVRIWTDGNAWWY